MKRLLPIFGLIFLFCACIIFYGCGDILCDLGADKYCDKCKDYCISGSKQCYEEGYQTCGNYDDDNCLEWSSITNCPPGQTCSGGVCINPADPGGGGGPGVTGESIPLPGGPQSPCELSSIPLEEIRIHDFPWIPQVPSADGNGGCWWCPNSEDPNGYPYNCWEGCSGSCVSTRNCGPSSYLMIERYLRDDVQPTPEDIQDVGTWLNSKFSSWELNCGSGDFTDAEHMRVLFRDYGSFDIVTVQTHSTVCDIYNAISRSHPVIVHSLTQGGNYSVAMNGDGFSHWMVFTGISRKNIRVNDAGRISEEQGHDRLYTLESFSAIWDTFGEDDRIIIEAWDGAPNCPEDAVCTGRECGPDPVCGISCGTCEFGECVAGHCTCDSDECDQGDIDEMCEICNGMDDDSDGLCDEGFECCAGSTEPCTTFCGSVGSHTCSSSCIWGTCISPAEACGNCMDDDCDGLIDEGCCIDSDVDGYGMEGTSLCGCLASTSMPDCDDTDLDIYPGAPDICDLKVNDCAASEGDFDCGLHIRRWVECTSHHWHSYNANDDMSCPPAPDYPSNGCDRCTLSPKDCSVTGSPLNTCWSDDESGVQPYKRFWSYESPTGSSPVSWLPLYHCYDSSTGSPGTDYYQINLCPTGKAGTPSMLGYISDISYPLPNTAHTSAVQIFQCCWTPGLGGRDCFITWDTDECAGLPSLTGPTPLGWAWP